MCLHLVLPRVVLPLNFTTHTPTYYLMWDHALISHCSLSPLSFMELLSWEISLQHMWFVAYNSSFKELRFIISRYISRWSKFSLRILLSGSLRDHYHLRILCLVEQTIHYSIIVNTLLIVWLFANITPIAPLKAYRHVELTTYFILLQTYPSHVKEKVLVLHSAEFRSPWDGQEQSIVCI